jgi:MtrB/PioB family decaheme-associated outer membrane protein
MKSSSSLYLLWTLGVLGLAGSGAAFAGNPAEWTCESCPFEEAGKGGSVELGVGAVSDESAKFGDYTGLNKQGAYGIAGGDAYYRNDDGLYGKATASDLGLDTRRINAEGGREGSYSLRLGYSEIPRHFSDTAVTPFVGAGSAVQTLPAGFPAATTGDMPQGAFTATDIGYKRSRLEAGASFYTGDNWTSQISVKHDTRDGTRLTSGSFYSTSSQLVAPVDEVTDQIEASTSYSAKNWQLTLSYYGSIFHNSNDSLTWANPFNPVVPGATTGQLALAPDNQFHQLLASGTYKLLPNLRLSADVAVGQMTQNESFVPITQNASLAATLPALPASSLDGKVNTYNDSFRLAYAPFDSLRVNASYTHNGHDNRTASLDYPAVSTDMFVWNGVRANQPFSYKQDLYKINADYRGPSWFKGSGGFDENDRMYTYQDVATTREGTVWGRVGAQMQDILSVSLKLAHGERKNQGYGSATWVDPAEDPYMRKYNLANRTRNTGSLLAEITPADGWTVGLHLDMSTDDYTDSTVGLTDARSRAYGADLTAALTDNLRLRLFAEAERLRSNQAGSSSATLSDWTAQNEDSIDLVGLGVTQLVLGGKLELKADLTYSRSESDVTVIANPSDPLFPTAVTTVQSVKLNATYKLSEKISLNGGYWYEKYQSSDWRYDGVMPTTVSNFLSVGEQTPNYNVNVVTASVRYRF